MGNSMGGTPYIRCLMIGETGAGKTALVESFVNNTFIEKSDKTREEPEASAGGCPIAYSGEVDVGNNKIVKLDIIDVPGGKDKVDERRDVYFTEPANVIVFCFDAHDSGELNTITALWATELQTNAPWYKPKHIPAVLVATKCDQLSPEGETQVDFAPTYSQLTELKKTLGVRHYLDCSTVENKNVTQTFQEAIKLTFRRQRRSSGGACNMCLLVIVRVLSRCSPCCRSE